MPLVAPVTTATALSRVMSGRIRQALGAILEKWAPAERSAPFTACRSIRGRLGSFWGATSYSGAARSPSRGAPLILAAHAAVATLTAHSGASRSPSPASSAIPERHRLFLRLSVHSGAHAARRDAQRSFWTVTRSVAGCGDYFSRVLVSSSVSRISRASDAAGRRSPAPRWELVSSRAADQAAPAAP